MMYCERSAKRDPRITGRSFNSYRIVLRSPMPANYLAVALSVPLTYTLIVLPDICAFAASPF
jgi:hypothetical protein